MTQYESYVKSLSEATPLNPNPTLTDPAGGAGFNDVQVTANGATPYDQYIATISDGSATPDSPKAGTVGTGNQIGAGIDTGQALLWEAANQLSHAMGFTGSESQTWLKEKADENWAEAQAVPAYTLWDQVQRGVGTAAVGAPLVIPALPFGGAAVGAASALTSAAFNIGDISFKAEDLGDEDFQASGTDWLVAGALGAPEAIAAGRIFKWLNKAKPAMGETVRQAVSRSAPSALATVGIAGVGEGAQDFATSVQAYNATDTDITDEAIDGFVDDAIMEATVGALIAGPIGATQVAVDTVAATMPDRVTQRTDAEGNLMTDEEGNPVWDYNAPTVGAAKDAGLWKRGAARVFGRSTDRLKLEMPNNKEAAKTFEHFVQNPNERVQMVAAGRHTVTQDVQEQLYTADILKGAQADFFRASDEAANAAMQDKAKGLKVATDPENQKALDAIWSMDNKTVEMASASDIDFRARSDNYVPWIGDGTKIVEGKDAFLKELYDDAIAVHGEKKGKKYYNKTVVPYVENLVENKGRYIATDNSSKTMGDILEKNIEAMHKAPADKRRKMAKRVNRTIRDMGAKVNRANALEQVRMLDKTSDDVLQRWSTSDNAKDIYWSHAKKAGQRLAHVEKWGASNEKYWEAVSRINQEEVEHGRLLSASSLKDFTNLMAIAQKDPIHSTSINSAKRMRQIRFFQNVNKLPLALIPSIAETLFLYGEFGTVEGLKTQGRLIWGGMRKKAGGRGQSPSDQRILDDLAMSTQEAMSVMSARVADDTFNPTVWETKFFNVTGLPLFTEGLRMTAAVTAEKSLIDTAADLNSTDKAKVQRAVRKSYEAGVNPNDLNKWAQDPEKYESDFYNDVIRPATLSLAEDVVVHPTPLKKPMWHSDQRLMLVAHMKSFSTVFTNGIMRNWFDNMTQGTRPEQIAYASKLFPLIASFVAMQASLAGLREWIKTGDTEKWDEKTFAEHVMQGLSYLGMPGMGAESAHMSQFGISPIESALGPTAGDISRAMKGIGKAMAEPEKTVDVMIEGGLRAIPNAPGAEQIRTVLREALGVQ